MSELRSYYDVDGMNANTQGFNGVVIIFASIVFLYSNKPKYMNKYECFFYPAQKQLTHCIIGITVLFSVVSHANQDGDNVEPVLSELAIFSNTTAVTCTDATIVGDVASSVSVTQTNCYHEGNVVIPIPTQVFSDFSDEYSQLADLTCQSYITTLAGQILEPGIYCFDQASTNTGGVLTLDGDAEDRWVFKIEVGALTGTDFVVKMINGANACNVDWWVAEAATITRGDFKGDIYAGGAITVTGAAPTSPFQGRALANGAVTLTNSKFMGCVSEQETIVVEEPTSPKSCAIEPQNEVVYVEYNNSNEGSNVVAVMTLDSESWYKYEEGYLTGPFYETKRDEIAVYMTDGFSEFHIDLITEVVNECVFMEGSMSSACERRSIIFKSSDVESLSNLSITSAIYDYLDDDD